MIKHINVMYSVFKRKYIVLSHRIFVYRENKIAIWINVNRYKQTNIYKEVSVLSWR